MANRDPRDMARDPREMANRDPKPKPREVVTSDMAIRDLMGMANDSPRDLANRDPRGMANGGMANDSRCALRWVPRSGRATSSAEWSSP